MNSSFKASKPRGGIKRRLFAYLCAHSGETYNLNSDARKRALLNGLHGDILEIGPGSGPNLRYYPAGIRWLGVEPNPFMHPYLQQSIAALHLPDENYRIHPGDPGGVQLPAADASMDAVVSTLVLCSVPHPEESLAEILRVLKPGGRFVFIEHVAAPKGTTLRAWQNILQPAWSYFGEGCHLNRETWHLIAQAGFVDVQFEHYDFPGGGPVAPHIAGSAAKAEGCSS